MKAIREIGWGKALKFGWLTVAHALYQLLLFPPLRTAALRLMGAHVGVDVIIHPVRFLNLYRRGFRGLRIGDNCFLGNDCLIDLADAVIMEEHVTLAERVTVLTHTNVGYSDHPLQPYFPSTSAPVILRRGAFVGASATLLQGVEIGECAMVAAGAVVVANVPSFSVVGGVPARVLRFLKQSPDIAS